MKSLTSSQFQSLPSGFQESIRERSQIYCAVENTKQFLKYVKQCAISGDPILADYGKTALQPYYKELLAVEHLAKKYHELWSEQFYKIKLQSEKVLGI
ncbi:MAG: hypothetical protein KBC56_04850 [Flavobacterium sp.]|nr:hypothetical protein [Flavobacterium sp.]